MIQDILQINLYVVYVFQVPFCSTGADDATSSYNDGRVGTAFIQELRFNKYCERLQGLIIEESHPRIPSVIF